MARLCLLVVEMETIKITKATGVNGKFAQPSVVYRWRWSFFFTNSRTAKVTVDKFSPLEMVVMDIATLMHP